MIEKNKILIYNIIKRAHKKFSIYIKITQTKLTFTKPYIKIIACCNIIPWPDRIPNLNIIENVWHMMVNYLQSNDQYRTLDNLVQPICSTAKFICNSVLHAKNYVIRIKLIDISRGQNNLSHTIRGTVIKFPTFVNKTQSINIYNL